MQPGSVGIFLAVLLISFFCRELIQRISLGIRDIETSGSNDINMSVPQTCTLVLLGIPVWEAVSLGREFGKPKPNPDPPAISESVGPNE